MKVSDSRPFVVNPLDEVVTARLRLTRPRPEDLTDLIRINRDAKSMALLLGVRSAQETEGMLTRMIAHWEQHGFGWWVVFERDSGEFVGRGGLRQLNVEGKEEVEVAYGFLSEFWGRGYATELARESMRVGFKVLGLPELVCFTRPENKASERVMQKAGFVFERNGEWFGVPHVFYRLTRKQWEELRHA